MLIDAALNKGALYIKSNNSIINKVQNNRWNIHITTGDGDSENIEADMLIDATGRLSYIARKQKIRRLIYDRLIGIITVLHSKRSDPDYMTLIESVRDGWWYSTKISENSRIAIFFTYGDLPIVKYAQTTLGWKNLLKDTILIKNSIESACYDLTSGPYIIAANSSKLKNVIGKNWMAVGDAAATYDPLSSQGIMLALATGMGAANAILWYFNGKTSALAKYEENLNYVFSDYLKKRNVYYNKEQRWSFFIFWKQARRLVYNV